MLCLAVINLAMRCLSVPVVQELMPAVRIASFSRTLQGSWYQRSDPRLWTWCSNVGNTAKEILQNCRVYRSAVFCGTNHRFVVATPWVHFKTLQQSNDHHRVFHLEKQSKGESARGVAETISGRFTALNNLTDPVLLWDTSRLMQL